MTMDCTRSDPHEGEADPAEILGHGANFWRMFWGILVTASATYVMSVGALRIVEWSSSGGAGYISAIVTVDRDFAMNAQGVLVGTMVFVNFFVWTWSSSGPGVAQKYALARVMSAAAIMVAFASVFVTIGSLIPLAPHTIRLVEMVVSIVVMGVVVAAAVGTSSGLEDGTSLPRDVARVSARLTLNRLERNRNDIQRLPMRVDNLVRKTVVRFLTVYVLATVPAAVYMGWRGTDDTAWARSCGVAGILVAGLVSMVTAVGVVHGFARGRATLDTFWTVYCAGFGLAIYSVSALVVASIATQSDVSPWKHWALTPAAGWMVFIPVFLVSRESRMATGGVLRVHVHRSIRKAILVKTGRIRSTDWHVRYAPSARLFRRWITWTRQITSAG